jgi:hypothetical protein
VNVLLELRAAWISKQGDSWTEHGSVFESTAGTELEAANVRRAFRSVIKDP